MTTKELSVKYNRDSGTIIGKLKSLNVFTPSRHRFTKEDIEFLKEYYPIGNWDAITAKFPGVTKQCIMTTCSNHNIHSLCFWSKHDEEILRNNYYSCTIDELYELFDGKYTKNAINSKGLKLGMSKDRTWTKEEIDLLYAMYPTEQYKKLEELLSNRTWEAIVTMAKILKIPNYLTVTFNWNDEQINILKNNWLNMSDEDIAIMVNKTIESVKEKRRNLGLLRINHKNSASYESLQKYLRGRCSTWKLKSMELCEYKCVLTGSKDFEIHHIYSFSNIFQDTINKYNIQLKETLSEYTNEELDYIENVFMEEHNKLYGVCIRRDLHDLFHKIYGKKNNQQQWDDFIQKYKNKQLNSDIA